MDCFRRKGVSRAFGLMDFYPATWGFRYLPMPEIALIADHAQTPKALFFRDADGLLDISWIMTNEQGRKVLQSADHRASLPF